MDLSIYSTGNGSDTDFALTGSLFNYVYLYCFGGNVEENTPNTPTEGKQRLDWFGNGLLNEELQFNSNTERALKENALTSQGLKAIKDAIETDLKPLKKIADIEVFLNASNVDKLQINVSLNEPNGNNTQNFNFIWDATRNELIEQRIL